MCAGPRAVAEGGSDAAPNTLVSRARDAGDGKRGTEQSRETHVVAQHVDERRRDVHRVQHAHKGGREVFRLWVYCDRRGAFWNVLHPYGLGEQDWSARASRVSVKERTDVLDVAPIVLYHVGRGDDYAEAAVPVE